MPPKFKRVDRALLSRALQLDFLGSHVLYAYPRAYFDLLSRGEAIRDKPAQYISMGARVSVRVVPNMEALPCLQTGSEPSTALFSPARSSSIYWVPTYYTPLVKPIHSLISTFSPVGRLFGTSRPNTH